MDAVALGEDERAHLRVPAAGLVAEVDAGLEQLPHRNGRHGERPPVGLFLRGPRAGSAGLDRGHVGLGRHRPGRNGPRVISVAVVAPRRGCCWSGPGGARSRGGV